MNKQKQHDALHLESLQTCRHTLALRHSGPLSAYVQWQWIQANSVGQEREKCCMWFGLLCVRCRWKKEKEEGSGNVVILPYVRCYTNTHICSVCFWHWKRCSEVLFVCKVGWTTHTHTRTHTCARTPTHTCRGLGPERDVACPPKSPYHAGRYLREQGQHTRSTKPAAANELLLYTLMKYNCITVGK